MVESLCAPALIFLIFSIIQIFIDIFKTYYNQAFFKFISMILVTLLLNILCKKGLGIIAWMLVFIPFILMTLISVILIIVFGLNPSEGDYTVDVIDNEDDNNDNDDNEDEDNTDEDNTNNNTDNNNNTKKIVIIDPRNNYKNSYYNNSNTKNIYISTDGEIDEGMLNYSNFNPSKTYKRRGKITNNNPVEPETTSTDTFLKNMFKKIL
jgi:energy-coupling factor transporter transmembrane protein EcfT